MACTFNETFKPVEKKSCLQHLKENTKKKKETKVIESRRKQEKTKMLEFLKYMAATPMRRSVAVLRKNSRYIENIIGKGKPPKRNLTAGQRPKTISGYQTLEKNNIVT